jgi:hypothetical protein
MNRLFFSIIPQPKVNQQVTSLSFNPVNHPGSRSPSFHFDNAGNPASGDFFRPSIVLPSRRYSFAENHITPSWIFSPLGMLPVDNGSSQLEESERWVISILLTEATQL